MRAPTQRCGRRSRRAARRRCLPRSCARDLWLRRRAGVTARRSVVSRKSAPPGGGERPRTRKSPANAGLSLMRRRGLEPPPGYPGPGPQPLVTRVSDPSYASISSRTSALLDASDAMDDLDVATDVATAQRRSERTEGLAYLSAALATVGRRPPRRTDSQCWASRPRRCMSATAIAPTTSPRIADAVVLVSQAPTPPAAPSASSTSSSRWWTVS